MVTLWESADVGNVSCTQLIYSRANSIKMKLRALLTLLRNADCYNFIFHSQRINYLHEKEGSGGNSQLRRLTRSIEIIRLTLSWFRLE